MEIFPIIIVVALVVISAVVAARETRRNKAALALLQQIIASDQPLFSGYSSGLRFRVEEINSGRFNWRPFVIAVTPTQIALHPITQRAEAPIMFTPDELRWFGRPKKYTSGPNEMWLHIEHDRRWFLIRLRLYQHRMQGLVRALKQISDDEMVTAYRRRRPYIHYGPVTAQPATQDMLGAWVLDKPSDLYLMPLFLVVLEGSIVRRLIPLKAVQNVTAIKRLDRPRAAGLVRFEVDGEPFAFALDRYEALAGALAEAAKRTLEDPVQWQRKKKKPGDIDDDLDDDLDDDWDDDLDDVREDFYEDEKFYQGYG
jgi:hypothetical protein